MTLGKITLNNKVDALFNEQFVQHETATIPEITDRRLTHGATGLVGDFTFLYVDMRGSSSFTTSHRLQTIAKVYKAFHHCMVEAIKNADGRVRSFDGDRVMGVFGGSQKVDAAVQTALLIGSSAWSRADYRLWCFELTKKSGARYWVRSIASAPRGVGRRAPAAESGARAW